MESRLAVASVLAVTLGLFTVAAAPQGTVTASTQPPTNVPTKTKDLVDHIRLNTPPEVSTSTKRDSSGDKATDYHPAQNFKEAAAPPSPPLDRNNPQHDPVIQAAFDKSQKEHADKVAAENAAKGK